MTVCNRCGVSFKRIVLHTKKCSMVPTPDELACILEDETEVGMKELGERYGISYNYLYARLRGTQWIKERLAKRGDELRRRRLSSASRNGMILPQCSRCGLLVKPGVEQCQWCDLADEGITDYRGLLDVDAVVYVAEVV